MHRLKCLGCDYDIFATPPDGASSLWCCPECGRLHTNPELSDDANRQDDLRTLRRRAAVAAAACVGAIVLVAALTALIGRML